MNVLLQGLPFFCDYAVLSLYHGKHEIRTLSAKSGTATQYRFDPARESFSEVLGKISREWQPDLFICWHPENDPPPLGIEDSPIPTVAVAGDWNLFYSAQSINLARYDVVLCDKPGVPVLSSELVHPHYFLPLYSANFLIHKPYPVERDIDVLYVGNLNILHRRERAWLLDRLAMLSDRFRIAIVGGFFGEDYALALSRAKIVFNRSVRGELNLRVFETMACGALAFLEESNQEVRDWFRPDEEIVLFDENNLEEKIAYYLHNPADWERITSNATKRVREFAAENQMDKVIEFAGSQKSSGRLFRELPQKERLFQDYLQYVFRLETEYYPIQEKLAARAVESDEKDPRSWSILGQTLLRTPPERAAEPQTQAERCLKVFLQALRLAPDCGTLALNAASACKYCGADDLEPQFLKTATEATNADHAAYLIGDYTSPFWTRWLYAMARHETSLEMLKAEAHNRLAQFSAVQEDFSQAYEHLITARQLDPDNTSGIWLLGEIEWQQGKYTDALELLERHLRDFPLHEGFRLRLAAMHNALGNIDRARKYWEEAKRIAPALDRTALECKPDALSQANENK